MDDSIPRVGSSGEQPRTELQKRIDGGESPRVILEELYRRLQGKLLGSVRKSIRNTDAEDVVQQVFETMQDNFEKMIAREPVDAWIFLVARRKVADYYRAARKGPLLADPEIGGEDLFERGAGDALPGMDDAVAEQIDTAEQVLAHLLAMQSRGSISRADFADYWRQVFMGVPQQVVADERGVTQPRIAQRKAAVSKKVRISLYLCDVLGCVRRPYPQAAIGEHLDIFDTEPGPLKDADRELLRRAGSAVSRDPDGQVVLLREDAQAAIEDLSTGPLSTLDELHAAESVYATAIGNPAPHCIAAPCALHTATGGAGGGSR